MTKPFHPDLLRPGDRVRHYRVVRRLGNGGFASVFLVEHGGQPYTLKIATRPPSENDEAHEDERAFREAISLGHFRHPNLLTVREMGRWPDLERGHFFLVTDYVPGSTFNEWRWKTQAPLRRLVGVLKELVWVMAELHERGVFHRDIKADNVLVREGDDKPFLIDFGAAYLPGAYTLTQALPPVTFHNMPPEVAAFLRAGEWEMGARFPAHPAVDLYAFGALLYEALTDCHPFNPRLSPERLLLAIEFLVPMEPVRLDPRVPPGLNALVMRLLAKQPEQRPPSARAVHEELTRMLEEEGDTEAWTVPHGFRSARGGAKRLLPSSGWKARAASGTDGLGAERPRKGRRRALVVLALGMALLGLGWGLGREVCASALEVACPGAASTAPASPAPPEKGRDPLFPLTQKLPGGIRALFCAASAHLLACASAPVRPDVEGFLERCPPEALATAQRLGIEKPIKDVELVTGVDVSGGTTEGMLNVRSGPMEGWLFPSDENDTAYRVTGELRVLPDRTYIYFDRVYLDATRPERGRVPSPICAVVVSERDWSKFGVLTYEISPDNGAEVDPAKVAFRGRDAAILNAPTVNTYIQLPGHRFPR